MKRLFLLMGLITMIAGPLAAEQVPMKEGRWSLTTEGAAFAQHKGRESLHLTTGEARLIGQDFHNGIIEFDMAFEEKPGFPGMRFRDQGNGFGEAFYIRPDVPGKPDANQYTPVNNGQYAWQLYTGSRYAAPVGYSYR